MEDRFVSWRLWLLLGAIRKDLAEMTPRSWALPEEEEGCSWCRQGGGTWGREAGHGTNECQERPGPRARVPGRPEVHGAEPGPASWRHVQKPHSRTQEPPLSPGSECSRKTGQQRPSHSCSPLYSLNRNVCSNSENGRHLNVRHHHQNRPRL